MLTLLFASQASFASQNPKDELITCLKKKTNKDFDVFVNNLKNLQLKDIFAMCKRSDISDIHTTLADWSKTKKTDKTALLLSKLIDNGFDVYAKSSDYESLVDFSIRSNQKLLISLICCKKVDFNKSEKNWTPLLSAIHTNNPTTVRLLIQAGANPNQFDYGYPLTVAYDWKKRVSPSSADAVIQELILGGADTNKAIEEIKQRDDLKTFVAMRDGNIYSTFANAKALVTNDMIQNLLTYLLPDLIQLVLAYADHPTTLLCSRIK